MKKETTKVEAYFRFECPPSKETFVFKLTDPTRIQQARDILSGKEKGKTHVGGIIVTNPAPYNPPWHYHLEPQSISFFETSIEVCDASIGYVEGHLSEVGGSFLTGSRWCPWCSQLVEEVHESDLAKAGAAAGTSFEIMGPPPMTKRIDISFQANGNGTLKGDVGSFKCVGNVGRKYPTDLTIEGILDVDKFPLRHSNEFNVDMPNALLIWGQKGIFIHGWPGEATVEALGDDTAGCIHLSTDGASSDSKKVYDWVDGRTRILISYPW